MQDRAYAVHDGYSTGHMQCMTDAVQYNAVHNECRTGHMQGMTDAGQDISSACRTLHILKGPLSLAVGA